MKLSEAKYGHILDENYEQALSLENRYKFLNTNIFSLLTEREQKFVLELQSRCLKLYPKTLQHLDNVYALFTEFPKLLENLETYTIEEINNSLRLLAISDLCEDIMCPELSWAYGASRLCITSLLHNPNRSAVQETALKELVAGEKIGGIGITEPLKGSDAVNMQTMASIDYEKSTITYNGVKIFTTNGAVADYFSAYGVLDLSNPRDTMMLTLFKREDLGISTERINVPAGEPGVGIARVNYNNVTVPLDRMIAPPGEGYKRLFRGLVPERLGIVMQSIAFIWDSVAQGTIFTQIRHQFGKPIFDYQGNSHIIAKYYAQVAAYTAFALHIADFYDNKIYSFIHKGLVPRQEDESVLAFNAAQAKYLTANLAHQAVYEIVQTMGGRGSINELGSNCSISRLENLTRILEVTGGHRNVQLMLIEGGLKSSSLPFIQENIKKVKQELNQYDNAVFEKYLLRGRNILQNSKEKMSDATRNSLVSAFEEFDASIQKNNRIIQAAYAKEIPKIVLNAEKELKKSLKT